MIQYKYFLFILLYENQCCNQLSTFQQKSCILKKISSKTTALRKFLKAVEKNSSWCTFTKSRAFYTKSKKMNLKKHYIKLMYNLSRKLQKKRIIKRET